MTKVWTVLSFFPLSSLQPSQQLRDWCSFKSTRIEDLFFFLAKSGLLPRIWPMTVGCATSQSVVTSYAWTAFLTSTSFTRVPTSGRDGINVTTITVYVSTSRVPTFSVVGHQCIILKNIMPLETRSWITFVVGQTSGVAVSIWGVHAFCGDMESGFWFGLWDRFHDC